jgi:hypothetical protein
MSFVLEVAGGVFMCIFSWLYAVSPSIETICALRGKAIIPKDLHVIILSQLGLSSSSTIDTCN